MVLFFGHEYFNHQFIELRYKFGLKGDFVVPYILYIFQDIQYADFTFSNLSWSF